MPKKGAVHSKKVDAALQSLCNLVEGVMVQSLWRGYDRRDSDSGGGGCSEEMAGRGGKCKRENVKQ